MIVTFLAMIVSGVILWRICGYGAEHEPTGVKHVALVSVACLAAVATVSMGVLTLFLVADCFFRLTT